MRYKRCKCGKAEGWDSGMPLSPCVGCRDCMTTLAAHPDDHKPLAQHKLRQQFNRDTGRPDGFVCDTCHSSFDTAPEPFGDAR